MKGSRKDAEKALTELQAKADRGLIPTDRSTVGEYLLHWLEVYAKRNVQPTSYKRYEELVRLHIDPVLGKARLGKLTPLQLENLYGEVQETNCARTALKVHRLLYQVLKHAMRSNILPINVATQVDAPRPEEPMRFIPLPGDIQRVLAAAEGVFNGRMVYLATLTGLRLGELIALRWRDLDLANMILYVQRSAQYLPHQGTTFKQPKTKRSIRAVPLTEETVANLRQHRVQQTEMRLRTGGRWKDQDLVFPNQQGGPLTPSQVSWPWNKIRRIAGVPEMRFHDLRHAHATLLLTMGVHPKIVSERLGHAGTQVTMDTYSHVMAGVQAEAIKGLDRIVRG